MRRNYQQGSVHVVVTICLVIVLVFALGWIFWQNFVYKQPMEATTTNSNVKSAASSKVAERVKTKEVRLMNEKLTFAIPESWTADIATVGATQYVATHDNGSIKNADGVTVLHVASGIYGVGGSCEQDTKETLTIVDAVKTDMRVTPNSEEMQSPEVYAVKSYYHNPSKGYAAFVFLTNNKQAEVVGSYSTCLPSIEAMFSGKNVQGSVSIATNGGMTDNGASAMSFEQTKEQVLTTLDSDDMRQAYTILQTVHY